MANTNSQITDSVTQVNTSTIGQAPPASQGLLDAVMAETIGMGMHNAVSAQQNSQMAEGAAVAATCARLLQAQSHVVVAPPKPTPTPTPPQPGPEPTLDTESLSKERVAKKKLVNDFKRFFSGDQRWLRDELAEAFPSVFGGRPSETTDGQPESAEGAESETPDDSSPTG